MDWRNEYDRTRCKRNCFSGNTKKVQDQSAAHALRKILFDPNNKIDWKKAGFSIIENMPELRRSLVPEWK